MIAYLVDSFTKEAFKGNPAEKTNMKAFQSSSHTGYMALTLKDGKVLLKSQAVIILKGNLLAFNNDKNPIA